jgi:alcohol dehydrogenase class IV
LIEPFVCNRANPLVDALCREGLPRVARSLRTAFEAGRNPTARTDMAFAALLGGLALANAGLGVVHGLAAPLGGSHAAPHGAVCAALLPPAMEANLRAMKERQPDLPALDRYRVVARLLTGRLDASADDAVAWCGRSSSFSASPAADPWSHRRRTGRACGPPPPRAA